MTRLMPAIMAAAFTLSVAAASAQAQKSKRPRTIKALVNHVVSSLAANDLRRFLVLAPTMPEVVRHCQGMKMRPKMIQKLHKRLTRGFQRCGKAFNWKRARLVSFKGGATKRPVKECGGVVWELKDIKVVVKIDGKRRHMTIDDPFVLNGNSYGTTDRLRCSDGSAVRTPPKKAGATVPPPPPPAP